jgi:hypothetical protein
VPKKRHENFKRTEEKKEVTDLEKARERLWRNQRKIVRPKADRKIIAERLGKDCAKTGETGSRKEHKIIAERLRRDQRKIMERL